MLEGLLGIKQIFFIGRYNNMLFEVIWKPDNSGEAWRMGVKIINDRLFVLGYYNTKAGAYFGSEDLFEESPSGLLMPVDETEKDLVLKAKINGLKDIKVFWFQSFDSESAECGTITMFDLMGQINIQG